MTYTLAMAADQGIQIAEDGTPEVSMTSARAHLTAFIREVRWGKKVSAFTERGERTAYVVPPEYFDRAESALRKAAAFDAAMRELPPAERPQKFLELYVKKLAELDDD
jgi:prevent-host-death family protein